MDYKNKDLPIEIRAKDLLSRMTLEEKFQQITFNSDVNELYDELKQKGEITTRYGTFFLAKDVKIINELQDYAVNKTRLGIPLLINWEGIHGILNADDLSNEYQFTLFPQCIGLGACFNPELVNKMAKVIGKEARAFGIRQLYAPNIDIPRDPRWGRTQENYGEDPYLTSRMGVAYVKGLQGEGVAATAKHYIAYGVGEGGLNISPAHIGEREIREVMLEPFKKCIEAGVMSVMPAYNEIDGIPVHASKHYLRDILRDELGFKGVTVSDYAGIRMLRDVQGLAADGFAAGEMGMKAGVDVEAPFIIGYCDELKQAVENGEFDGSLLDEAVLRILTLKFKLGLFENPYAQLENLKNIHSKEAVALSREMEEQSVVLLENNGILPLDENKAGKVAVIGNNAVHTFQGDYTFGSKHTVSFYDGIVDRLGKDRVLYALGCNPLTTTDEMIEEAVETAKKADTVFLVLGACSIAGGGEAGFSNDSKEVTDGEGYDVSDLNLLPSQRRLFDAITALGKPTVLVVYSGRPYTLEKDADKVDALLWNFGGGEQTGNAMASLIFGDKSPSAKLAISFPKEVGALPCYYNHKISARGYYHKPGAPEAPGRDYIISTPEPWHPFGYGLSYTKLNYSDLTATVTGDNIEVNVMVENVGNYDINENVLVFVRTMVCPITPFVKRLRAFCKVPLKVGEKKCVSFTLTRDDFTYIDEDYNTAYATGIQKIMVENLECEIQL